MYCTKCGCEIKNNSRFCNNCGQKLFFEELPTYNGIPISTETQQDINLLKMEQPLKYIKKANAIDGFLGIIELLFFWPILLFAKPIRTLESGDRFLERIEVTKNYLIEGQYYQEAVANGKRYMEHKYRIKYV